MGQDAASKQQSHHKAALAAVAEARAKLQAGSAGGALAADVAAARAARLRAADEFTQVRWQGG